MRLYFECLGRAIGHGKWTRNERRTWVEHVAFGDLMKTTPFAEFSGVSDANDTFFDADSCVGWTSIEAWFHVVGRQQRTLELLPRGTSDEAVMPSTPRIELLQARRSFFRLSAQRPHLVGSSVPESDQVGLHRCIRLEQDRQTWHDI